MKSIKKIFRVIFCFMAFAFASLVFAINPTAKAYATKVQAGADYQKAINALKLPSKVDAAKKNEEFRIPLLSKTFADYTIKVIDPAGQAHTYNSVSGASESDAHYFDDSNKTTGNYIKVLPLNDGYYDVIYITNHTDGDFYSNKYTVRVTNVSYELDFTIQGEGADAGKKVLVPSAVKTNSEKVKLPIAYAKNTATDEVSTEKIFPIVRKNNITEIGLSTDTAPTVLSLGEDGYYYLDTTEKATYTVEYAYNNGSNPPKKTFEIEVRDDYEASTADDLHVTTPTMPSVELGSKEIKLPKLTVSDKYTNNVDYNATITITKVNNANITKTLKANTVEFDMTKEFFSTADNTIENYASMIGDYRVTYHIETADASKDYSVVIKNVTDSTLPKVYMAYDYDVTEENNVKTVSGKVNTDYAVDFKSDYGYSELVFPAIYAEDSVTDYNGFTFVRYIQKANSSQIYYLDNVRMQNGVAVPVTEGESGYNWAAKEDGNTVGQANKAVKFKFIEGELTDATAEDYAGEYTLYYYVFANTVGKQENYVYETGNTRYKFNIVSTPTATGSSSVKVTTPTININNVKNNASINSDDELTVKVTSSDEGDTRLKNVVFKFYGTKDTVKADVESALASVIVKDAETSAKDTVTADRKSNVLDTQAFIDAMTGYTAFTRLDVNEDNNNSFDLVLSDFADHSSETNVTIVAVTINNFGNIAVDTRVLKINNLNDTVAPVITGNIEYDDNHDWSTGVKTYNQGDEVLLPTLTFSDDKDDTLAKSVVYYVDSPESTDLGIRYLSPSNKQFNGNSIVGGMIKAGKVGKYYVVYTATDDAGNTTSAYFTFVVEGVSKPVFNVDVAEDEDISKSGQTITAKTGTEITFNPAVSVDGEEDTSAVIKYTVDDNGMNLHWEPSGSDEYSLKFYDAGSYTITFTTGEGEDALEKVVFVNITRPTLAWEKTPTVQSYAKKGEVVNLDMFSATEGKGGEKANVSVEVTKPNGTVMSADEVKLVTIGEGSNARQVWQFNTDAKASGTYKVVYTAKTINNKISTEAYLIRVGDNVKPVINMNYEKELKQNITYTGDDIEYKIELQRYDNSSNNTKRHLIITVTNGNKQLYKYDTGLEIKDMDDSGSLNSMSWSRLNVELTGDSGVLTKSSESTDSLIIYTISGKGDFELKLSITDSNQNSQEKVLPFKVVEKTEVKEENDLVVGVALIIVSLVVLAGVILFFALTGKKSSAPKAKKNKKENVKVEESNKTAEVVEEKSEDEVVEVKDDENKDAE